MAATPLDVRAINGSQADDEQIQVYLDAAACILAQTAICVSVRAIDPGCVDTAQAWLAAHLMGISAPHQDTLPTSKETFENYSVERLVSSFDASGVMSTSYGQTANSLTGGCLQEVDKAPMAVGFYG